MECAFCVLSIETCPIVFIYLWSFNVEVCVCFMRYFNVKQVWFQVHAIEKSPSMSELNEILLGQVLNLPQPHVRCSCCYDHPNAPPHLHPHPSSCSKHLTDKGQCLILLTILTMMLDSAFMLLLICTVSTISRRGHYFV